MNEIRKTATRSVEVQLENRPVEAPPTPTIDLILHTLSPYTLSANPGAVLETSGSKCADDQPVGTLERSSPAEEILEAYQGTVVVIEVGKDTCLPARPAVPGKI